MPRKTTEKDLLDEGWRKHMRQLAPFRAGYSHTFRLTQALARRIDWYWNCKQHDILRRSGMETGFSKVSVCVNFDVHSDELVALATDYCRRVQGTLRLVHVCEPLNLGAWSTLMGEDMLYADVLATAHEESKSAASDRLAKIAAGIRGISVVPVVLAGAPAADLIAADALTNGVGMIFVGAAQRNYRFVPRGNSVALSLMAHSHVPVFVKSGNASFDIHKKRLRMLIADDLSEESSVVAACQLAACMNDVDVKHVHVAGLDVDTLRLALASVSSSSHKPINPMISADSIVRSGSQALEAQLHARVKRERELLQSAGCTYHAELVTSQNFDEALTTLIEGWSPDLLVFGRHHTFHRKSFTAGHVPFYAMLAQPCPVVVLP